MLPGITPAMLMPAIGEFPVVNDIAYTTDNVASTSHVINMPANIQAGDLLLACVGTTAGVSAPAGWTTLDTGLSASYRIATGTAADAMTFTNSSAQTLAAVVFRITNYTGVPESASITTSNVTTHDPPAFTPSWGLQSVLWIATVSVSGSAINGFPPLYPDKAEALPTIGPNNYCMTTVRRKLKAATEDPGAFTSAAAASARARTIAIRGKAPAGAVTPGSATITVSGNWTVPVGFNPLNNTVECYGGGGGGHGGNDNTDFTAGGGGGGGAYAKKNNISVTVGQVFAVTIGAGGAGSPAQSSGSVGGNGGATGLSNGAGGFFAQAAGGGGAPVQSGDISNGGAGGSGAASIGDVKFSGGPGDAPASAAGGVGSGCGGPNGNGTNSAGGGGLAGGPTGASGGVGATGNQYGGGGGGGARGTPSAGGPGFQGVIKITWGA